jgi:hypothetical protein
MIVVVCLSDGVTNLCRLGDVTHRVLFAAQHDTDMLQLWLTAEQNRLRKATSGGIQRQQRLDNLFGGGVKGAVALTAEEASSYPHASSNSAVNDLAGALQTIYNTRIALGEKMNEAVIEEEAARKVPITSMLITARYCECLACFSVCIIYWSFCKHATNAMLLLNDFAGCIALSFATI